MWRLGIIVLFLLMSACSMNSRHGTSSKYLNYKVQRGDTLYSIAWRYGYDAREVAAWNGLDRPYTIYPGQTLVIISPQRHRVRSGPTPAERQRGARPTSRAAAPTVTTTPATSTALKRDASEPNKRVEAPQKRSASMPQPVNRKVVWNWPTRGKLLQRFDPTSGSKGIDIDGSLGAPVHAAASGKVVYSGKGLIGYGNLIIIKHNDIYLSAYGHNSRLLVKEGEQVTKGQLIAKMGKNNNGATLLHFEIRKRGKPINPLWYLPK